MTPFLALLPSIIDIINKVIPNKAEAARIQGQIMLLQTRGELSKIENEFNVALRQLEINAAEASSNSIFVSGWRPFVGWACGISFVLVQGILPIFSWVATLLGHPVALPQIDLSASISLLLGMLGVIGARTYEKRRGIGVDSDR